jgi:hypothetical protein
MSVGAVREQRFGVLCPDYFFFLSVMVTDWVCEVGLPPSEDWNVRVAVTGSPRLCLSA